jgi:hypothetical protein
MKLIGAGLPRTATLTQKVALEMLGFPCYHMVNVLSDLDLVRPWRDAYEGRAPWDEIFDGFEATVDWPGGYFYGELMEVYPDARVLLSVRDPEGWAQSMHNTIWDVMYGDSVMHHVAAARQQVDPQWADYISLMRKLLWEEKGPIANFSHDKPGLMEAFVHFNETVQRTVPSEKLLVWQPADGWEPLCEFLGADVPQAPLPHVNDSKMFVDRVIDGALPVLNEWWERERPATLA